YLRVQPAAAAHLAVRRDELRALVAGSVEGLEPAAVTLVLSEVVTTVPLRGTAPERSGWRPELLVLGLMVLGAGSAAAGVLIRRRGRREAAPTASVALRPVVQSPLARREAG
ncbi:MAG: hypothetical protein ACXWLG_07670, partial [Myxococcaceae bacterium]